MPASAPCAAWALPSGAKIVTPETKATMRQILKDIQEGRFAKQWMEENEQGLPNFKRMREADRNHPVEQVGVIEIGTSEIRTGEIYAAEIGAAEIRAAEICTAKIGII